MNRYFLLFVYIFLSAPVILTAQTGLSRDPTPVDQLNLITFPLDTIKHPLRLNNYIALDIDMPRYDGYSPRWKYIGYRDALTFQTENLQYGGKPSMEKGNFSFTNAKGKLSIYVDGVGLNCRCIMEIQVPEGKAVLINNTAQTFGLGPCHELYSNNGIAVIADEPYKSHGINSVSGLEGTLTLQTSRSGEFNMSIVLQSYIAATARKPRMPVRRYTATDIKVSNEIPPDLFVYDAIVKKPESEFLPYLFSFFINGKDAYNAFERLTYLPATLKINNIMRDKEGKLTEATASYKSVRSGMIKDDTVTYHTVLKFDHGLVYRVSHPDEPVYDDIASRLTKNGKLIFSPAELATVDALNKNVDDQEALVNEASRKKSLEDVLAKQKVYSGKSCTECLTKEITPEYYTYKVDDMDEKGNIFKVEKHATRYNITIANTCKHAVWLVGIKKELDRKKGFYYKDVTRSFAAGYKSTFEAVPELMVLGITNDINFNDINPVYDDKEAPLGSIRYLRIVYK